MERALRSAISGTAKDEHVLVFGCAANPPDQADLLRRQGGWPSCDLGAQRCVHLLPVSGTSAFEAQGLQSNILLGAVGAGEGNRTLVFSLEGYRVFRAPPLPFQVLGPGSSGILPDFSERSIAPSGSPEAQAGSPAEALPSQSGAGETERLVGKLEEMAAYFEQKGMFGSAENARLAAAALAKPASEPAGGGVREALKAIAEGYAVAVHDDRYITVDNPRYQPDDGSAPKLVIDTAALSASSSPAEAEALQAGVDAVRPYGEVMDELDRAYRLEQETPEGGAIKKEGSR